MRTPIDQGSGRGRGYGLFLLLLALFGLMPHLAAGDASYSVSGLVGANPSASGVTLDQAITAINNAVETDRAANGTTYGATVNITLGVGTSTSGSAIPGYWHLHGTGNGLTSYSPMGGFTNVTLRGQNATDKHVLRGNGTGSSQLLKILNVRDNIAVENLKVTGGRYVGPGSDAIFGGEVGGAGMTLGGTGVANGIGPKIVSVKNVDVENNSIDVTTNTINNAFGAGILVNAHGLSGGGLAGNRGQVAFESVNLKNNSLTLTKANDLGASVRGGGARVAFGSRFTYTGGEVSDNSVKLVQGSHAAGGGLSVDDRTDGSGAYTDVTLTGVQFLRNTVTVVDASSTDARNSHARGGGFYFLGTKTGAPTEVLFNGGTVFEGNQAIGEIDISTLDTVHAQGGAAYVVIDTANLTLDGATFRDNKAESENGEAWGGALVVAGAGYANNGSLNSNAAVFEDNAAIGFHKSFGGGLYVNAGAGHVLTNNTFSGNKSSSSFSLGESYGGAVAFLPGNHTVNGGLYSENRAEALGVLGRAYGGALYFESGDQTVSNVTIRDNYASTASAGEAYGGGIYFGPGDSSISNSVIDGNVAESRDGTGSASGGGIYLDHGQLDITDSKIINNRVISNNDGYGSAIFVNMSDSIRPATVDSVVNLISSAGETFEIRGNKSNGVEYLNGIYFGGAGAHSYNGELNLKGSGDFILENPVLVEMNGRNFAMTKDAGTGNMRWDGINSFEATGAAASVTINDGILDTGKNFTVKGVGATDFTVTLNNVQEVRFDFERDNNTALFDFSDIIGTHDKILTVTPQTKLTSNLPREVKDFYKEYYIVSGMEEDDIDMGWFKLDMGGADRYLKYRLYDDENGNLIAGFSYKSPFGVTVNSREAMDALESLVKGKYGDYITDHEFAELVANANNITPETYMDQAHITLNAADLVARNAVDMGLRFPHRMRLQTGEMTIVGSEGSGSYGGDYDEYGEYEEEYYGGAYRSLTSCEPRSGNRIWAGYVGDWQKMDSHGGFNGYTVDRNGFVIGANHDFADVASIGIYGGYTYAKTSSRYANSEVKSDVGHFGALARWSPISLSRELSFYGDVGYHYADNDSYRSLGGYHAKGAFDQGVFTAGLGVEYVFHVGGYNLTPQAEGRFSNIDQDDLLEDGNSATVSRVEGFDKSGFTSRLGIEASRDFLFGSTMVSPTAHISWRHEYGNNSFSAASYYMNDPAAISHDVQSARISRDSMDIGAALRILKNTGTSQFGFNMSYNFNVGSHSTTHSVFAGVELGF